MTKKKTESLITERGQETQNYLVVLSWGLKGGMHGLKKNQREIVPVGHLKGICTTGGSEKHVNTAGVGF